MAPAVVPATSECSGFSLLGPDDPALPDIIARKIRRKSGGLGARNFGRLSDDSANHPCIYYCRPSHSFLRNPRLLTTMDWNINTRAVDMSAPGHLEYVK